MDMTGGMVYWQAVTKRSRGPWTALAGAERCEVVVIGGGIAGMLSAYELTRQGFDTVLIDRGGIGGASTSANTGLLQVSGDRLFTSLARSKGERLAEDVLRQCSDALERFERLCASFGADVGFARRSSLYYASTEADASALRQEAEALRRLGFEVSTLEETALSAESPLRRKPALRIEGDAEINPLQLTLTLAEIAYRHGLRIYEHTASLRMEADHAGVTVHTVGGVIRASRAVVAPGYEAALHWLPAEQISISGTYAIATEPVDLTHWPAQRSLIWGVGEPHLYLRTTPDDRIMIGGFDRPIRSAADRDRLLEQRRDRLLRALGELLPSYAGAKADYAWCGTFASTADGLPFIGERPDLPRCLYILGYGGSGTVYSMAAASRIGEWARSGSLTGLESFRLDRIWKRGLQSQR
ncbi:NAD(P)/FAD-dependent oxidoreductase [Paenibacillus chartarius]|uniref:NAD(P)/FAD-dependent oxidoreductase n=1 Tax=Paenibacillus chartarius TaxID=747481 RepID=A0ABV6DV62_9BACL